MVILTMGSFALSVDFWFLYRHSSKNQYDLLNLYFQIESLDVKATKWMAKSGGF